MEGKSNRHGGNSWQLGVDIGCDCELEEVPLFLRANGVSFGCGPLNE